MFISVRIQCQWQLSSDIKASHLFQITMQLESRQLNLISEGKSLAWFLLKGIDCSCEVPRQKPLSTFITHQRGILFAWILTWYTCFVGVPTDYRKQFLAYKPFTMFIDSVSFKPVYLYIYIALSSTSGACVRVCVCACLPFQFTAFTVCCYKCKSANQFTDYQYRFTLLFCCHTDTWERARGQTHAHPHTHNVFPAKGTIMQISFVVLIATLYLYIFIIYLFIIYLLCI